jgi:Tol biopolymer transport system component
LKRLTMTHALEASPDWSATGRQILYTSDQSGTPQIWVMDSEGTGARRVTYAGTWNDEGAWSPDGSKIAFAKNAPTWNWNIFSVNADGTGLTKITSHLSYELGPVWSPSGRRIAFRSGRSGIDEIYIKNLRTGSVHRLALGMTASASDWSATGRIALIGASADGPFGDVYTVHPNGSGLLQLTNDAVNESLPNISPDGSLVAYAGYNAATSSWDVYSVASTGGVPVDISGAPDAGDFEPAWSPDGSMIVFHSIRDFHNDVYLMNADGSYQAIIDNGADNDSDADWQPIPV